MKTETLQPNYIDELVMIRTDLSDTPDDYYCGHDHLFSIVGIYDDSGLAVERYLYDAYGTATVLDADFSADADGISDIGNARLFHGKYLASFDSGDCEFYYYPYRDYSPTLGRWYQHEKLGMIPNDNKKINPFAVQAQYTDGMNLYFALMNNPISKFDTWGLKCKSCWPIDEWPTPGSGGSWGILRANWWFRHMGGLGVEFNANSIFSKYVKNNIGGGLLNGNQSFLPKAIERKAKPIAENLTGEKCLGLSFFDELDYYAYSWGDVKGLGTIGNGQADEYSDVSYKASCCFEKPCCNTGKMVDIKVRCKVQVTLDDLFGYHYYPNIDKFGDDYWVRVHMFLDYSNTFTFPCK